MTESLQARPSSSPPLWAEDLSYTPPGAQSPIVSLERIHFEAGSLVGLIGPNGAGKSTLIRMLLGFQRPSSGIVRVFGGDIAAIPARQRARRISYLGQYAGQDAGFSALEVVEMGAAAALPFGKFPGRSERRRAMEALRYVELGQVAERPFAQLSGGEKQIVLFARALVQDTPIILLDEPTASLDLGHEHQILAMVRELSAEGRTVVMAIHNLNAAAEFCDRLVLLDGGRVIADGAPDKVLTPQVLEAAYRIRVNVGPNGLTGGLRLDVRPKPPAKRRVRVHLIGGAGSAVSLTRKLFTLGVQVSGGICHELDSDYTLWKSLGIPSVSVPAFAEIDEAALANARKLVEAADLTILCGFPVGPGNLRNLDLAASAPNLLVLDDETGTCSREFFVGGAKTKFDSLPGSRNQLGIEDVVGRILSLEEQP